MFSKSFDGIIGRKSDNARKKIAIVDFLIKLLENYINKIKIMFDIKLTSWWIQDDIRILSEINLHDDKVNEFISSLVVKYIQEYFWVQNVWEWLNCLEERLNMRWGGFELLQNPINESYTLECLGCISQTSAILKEIIFHDGYEHAWDFRSCDVWSGTGILSLGAYVSWLRKWLKKGVLHLMDHEFTSLEKWKKVLQAIVWSSFEVNSILGDITDPNSFIQIGEEKIQFWISETIWNITPYFEIDSKTKALMIEKDSINFYNLSRTIDPFPEVVWSICVNTPDFKKDVTSWKVAFFPDSMNWLYTPNGINSRLELKTSWKGPQKLQDIWSWFEYIKPFDAHERWGGV